MVCLRSRVYKNLMYEGGGFVTCNQTRSRLFVFNMVHSRRFLNTWFTFLRVIPFYQMTRIHHPNLSPLNAPRSSRLQSWPTGSSPGVEEWKDRGDGSSEPRVSSVSYLQTTVLSGTLTEDPSNPLSRKIYLLCSTRLRVSTLRYTIQVPRYSSQSVVICTFRLLRRSCASRNLCHDFYILKLNIYFSLYVSPLF